MSSDEDAQSTGQTDETARTVGQLVKYSREVNKSETVGEVGSYALEATYHVLDGHPSPTVFEIARGDVRVLESMTPEYDTGDEANPIGRLAAAEDRTVIVTDDVAVEYESDRVLLEPPGEFVGDVAGTAIAAPSVFLGDSGAVGVVLLVQWDALDSVEAYHVKPVEYLADHLATAVANIRSHERLERARDDLARRKELIQMYDRLLRHDLGNDLQVIAGFSDELVSLAETESDEILEYATKINRTARSAADLVDRVGDLVTSLEAEAEPEVTDLAAVLTDAVEDVDAKFESLSVEYDPADFDVPVCAGDLLVSIFVNVLSNAVIHNDGSVTVDVYAAEPAPGTVAVGFADDGVGVPADVVADPFEMGGKGSDSDGSGLGLGFVRTLTESYGGTVSVGESHLGGADFRICLDRA